MPLVRRPRRLLRRFLARVGSGHRSAGPVLFVLVALAYLAMAQFVLWLNDPVNAGAGFWPAAGLVLGVLLLVPTRLWGWVLSAVAVAEFGGDVALGYSVLASAGWTVGNIVGPLVGALLMRRFGNPRGELTPVPMLLRFLALGVVAGPLVGASIGSAATAFGVGGEYADIWPKYVVGDALGVLIVAPVLLGLREAWPQGRRVEGLALFGGALTVALVVFSGAPGVLTQSTAYLLVPFLTWAALRFGVRGTALLSVGIALIANAYTATGDGPFALPGQAAVQTVTMLQAFLGIIAGTALVVAALAGELSDRDQVESALRQEAMRDPLTGLPNRARLAQVLAEGPEDGRPGPATILVCDVDHLKAVNDSLGHPAGDRLITGVADRIRSRVRPGDLVTRISGGEFVVVLWGAGEATLERLCDRIMRAVARPIDVGPNESVTPSLSIGVAVDDGATGAEETFAAADLALFEAKRSGRGRVVRFDERLRRADRERRWIESAARDALADDQIICVHQPEIVIATGQVFAHESLARWEHHDRGTISPADFVPALEAIGSAGALFRSMLAQSLAAQARWRDLVGSSPPVSVNLSALQLNDPELPRTIRNMLAAAGAPADALWLELTETAAADASSSWVITEIAQMGVHLALDDFGTGWSSISRLAEHPWELVKLDRSFIAGLGLEDRAARLVGSMIDMAHALGMRVVAEGVETESQLALLSELGCDIAQGYLLGRPTTAGEALERDLISWTRV